MWKPNRLTRLTIYKPSSAPNVVVVVSPSCRTNVNEMGEKQFRADAGNTGDNDGGSFFLQIAALRTRLRLAEEDVQAARREALLEEQARSLAKVEAARKKAAQAFARAEALRDRCARQVGVGFVAKQS